MSIAVTAGSGDPRSIITLTVTGALPGLTFSTNTPTAIHPSAALSGLLGFQTAGVWYLQWHAMDQFGASDSKVTQLTITDTPTDQTFEARAFTAGGNQTIRLRSGKPTWCVQIEPVNGDFDLTQVDLLSITLSDARVYGSSVTAFTDKSGVGGDRDRNGVDEITACLSRDDLAYLLSYDDGTADVPLVIGGRLITGGVFRATFSVRVIRSRGGGVHASVAPNPLNPQATLSIVLPDAGMSRVRLFDTSGRLVRTLLDGGWISAGPHTFPIDGRDGRGRPLGSGVYLYRVETDAGSASGRFVILR